MNHPSCLAPLPQSVRVLLVPCLEGIKVDVLGDCLRLEDKGLVMELDDLGEGENGDYDPDDPQDVPYLRFSFFRRVEAHNPEDELLEIHDSSYCTLVDARLGLPERLACAATIFQQVYAAVGAYPSEYCSGAKRACESASSMSLARLGGLAEALKAAQAHDRLAQHLPGARGSGRKTAVRM